MHPAQIRTAACKHCLGNAATCVGLFAKCYRCSATNVNGSCECLFSDWCFDVLTSSTSCCVGFSASTLPCFNRCLGALRVCVCSSAFCIFFCEVVMESPGDVSPTHACLNATKPSTQTRGRGSNRVEIQLTLAESQLTQVVPSPQGVIEKREHFEPHALL